MTSEFSQIYLKSFVLRECTFDSLSPGICLSFKIWILYMIYAFCCALDRILVNLEFWELAISFKEYLLPNMWVRMLNINLKRSLFVILWPSHWSCWCHRSLMLRNENPDTHASHSYIEDHSIVVIDATFSLIVIMLQTKSFVG